MRLFGGRKRRFNAQMEPLRPGLKPHASSSFERLGLAGFLQAQDAAVKGSSLRLPSFRHGELDVVEAADQSPFHSRTGTKSPPSTTAFLMLWLRERVISMTAWSRVFEPIRLLRTK